MRIVESPLPGVAVLAPDIHEDHRGFFLESYNQRRFSELGIHTDFVQDNHSRSERGVLRGLHYQLGHAQAKLVRVTRGRVFDVVADVRRNSPTFTQWVGVELSEDNRLCLFAAEGFAHGYLVLSETAEFQYKCSDFYSAADERGLPWDDPTLSIEWPLGDIVPTLSDRDSRWTRLADTPEKDLPEMIP